MVIDWRAPVANAYYENGLGKCSYSAPEGMELPIDLKLKRTYEIDEGKLLDYFDTEVVANDDLLMKYLSKNKEAVLGEIVATIQKEQNEIIRKSPFHNVIVQGVAAPGKQPLPCIGYPISCTTIRSASARRISTLSAVTASC